MPRPKKWRRVCCLPTNNNFGPIGIPAEQNDTLVMTVEEYETIRLVDHEGLNQEECAERMGVARTTVQRIYNEARQKLAKCLVEGKVLKIKGGDYKLCNRADNICGRGYCHRHAHKGKFKAEEN